MKNKKLIALLGSVGLVLVLVTLLFLPACANPAVEPGAVEVAAKEKEVAALEKEIAALEGKVATAEKEIAKLEAAAPAPALEPVPTVPVLPSSAEYPWLSPSIMPVVFVSGSDYEMGYQYGQQLGYYIEMEKYRYWTANLGWYTYDEIIHWLKQMQWHLKEYFPEEIDVWQGIADGATDAGYDVSYLDIMLINSYIWDIDETFTYPPGAEEEKLKQCSGWTAWGTTTTDGRLISASSGDGTHVWPSVLIAFPDDGNSFISTSCYPGMFTVLWAMNSKGVVMVISNIPPVGPGHYNYGIPDSSSIELLMRFCDTAEEAKDMLLTLPLPVPGSYHISDASGDAYLVEASAALAVVRQSGDFGESDFIYTAGSFFSPEWEEPFAAGGEGWAEFIEHVGWTNSEEPGVDANMEAWHMLNDYQGHVDVDFAKMTYRFTNSGETDTLAHLGNRDIRIAVPDELLVYFCTGPASQESYSWGNYQIANTNSFYELTLASSPAEVANEAKWAAIDEYIAQAYNELMMLDYSDPRYAPLNELFSQAKAEYFEGVNAYGKGGLASGDEALLYFSKAATAFTRAMAHAKQVYNALVPPATCPEDLGLAPLPPLPHYGD